MLKDNTLRSASSRPAAREDKPVNGYHAIAVGAAMLLAALPLSGTPSRAADPRVADLVQAGKIRLAIFLP